MRRNRWYVLLILSLVLVCPALVSATTVYYTAVNLNDTIPGQDRWEYRYTLSAFSAVPDAGFTMYFDPALYADLQNPIVPENWNYNLAQPDTTWTFDGVFDAEALTAGAATAPFSIDFTWLGTGTPGSQPFDIYQLDDAGDLTSLQSGMSTVPEPATALLLASGLAALSIIRRKRTRSGDPGRTEVQP
jgi:hypothetical protein